MEEYPEELRTPPVALVSLVGCPDLHATITAHLHAEQPPINALALPDFSKISILAKSPKDNPASSQPVGGILKRDWLAKHRTRVPAVVAALFNYDHVTGDPAQWLQVCTDLENLKYDSLLPFPSLQCFTGDRAMLAFCLHVKVCNCVRIRIYTPYYFCGIGITCDDMWNVDRAVMRGRNSKLVVVVVAQSNAKGMFVSALDFLHFYVFTCSWLPITEKREFCRDPNDSELLLHVYLSNLMCIYLSMDILFVLDSFVCGVYPNILFTLTRLVYVG